MKKIKNIVIVGASSSIGGEIVKIFLENNHKVAATYNSTVLQSEPNLTVLQADLLTPQGRDNVIEKTRSLHPLDVLILLPGHLPGKSLENYDEMLLDNTMDINFNSQAKLVRAFLPLMKQGSVILLMGSISGERGSYDPIYAAGKGAMIAFGKSLATWIGDKTRVNIISPSLIEHSTMYDEMDTARQLHHTKANPTGELVQAENLAKIIYDLTLPHWKHVNGDVIRVNGGSYV